MVMHDVRFPLQILTQAATQLGLEVRESDDFSKVVIRVSDGERHFFAGLGKIGMYPLNPHFAAALANDKAWSYQALTQAGFKVPQGKHFFVNDDWQEYRPVGRDIESALTYAKSLGYPVFVKPNDGSSGVLAELLLNPDMLKQHLLQIAKVSSVALIQEYINQPEYRIFVVDNRVEFIYQRTKPMIVGDGIKTVRQLIAEMNAQIPIASHQVKIDSPFMQTVLASQTSSLDEVLAKQERLQVAAHANLSSGGAMVELTEQVPEWLHAWAAQVAYSLGLRVAGIDVFSATPLSDATSDNDVIIIEVNSNPNLAGICENGRADLAGEIWKKILLKFFKNN
jgi:glutathione synthase/RimK-type ligase-like ATP-grasp enzyme